MNLQENINKNDVLKKLSSQIVSLRKEKGLTSAEFARRCEMESSNLARIEMGRANLTFYNLIRISNALEITVGELINRFEKN